MDAPERFEQLIAYLSSHLPAPVDQQPAADGSILFTGGSPGDVVVLLTQTSVTVAEYSGDWETPYRFVVKPRRVGVLRWRRLPESALMGALAQLIKGAKEARLSRYRVCRICAEATPPEWMSNLDVCQTCSEHQTDAIH